MLFNSFFPFGFQVSVKWFGGQADMSSSDSLDGVPGELRSLGGIMTMTNTYWVSGEFLRKGGEFAAQVELEGWKDGRMNGIEVPLLCLQLNARYGPDQLN